MQLSQRGIQFICSFEGFSSKPYLDVRGIPTIGYGTTHYPDTGKTVSLTDPAISTVQGLNYLKLHIDKEVSGWVNQHLPGLGQCQFDAVVSFCYNVGIGNFSHSHLIDAIAHHLSCAEITTDFDMFNKSGGKVINGLIRRRTAEANLYCNCKY